MKNTNQKVVENRAQRVVDQLLRETFTPDDDLPKGPSGRGGFPSAGEDRGEFTPELPDDTGEDSESEERTEVVIANEILGAIDGCGDDQTACLEQIRGLANELLALHGGGDEADDIGEPDEGDEGGDLPDDSRQ